MLQKSLTNPICVKKLSVLVRYSSFLCLFFSTQLQAQQHSISITLGPSAISYLTDDVEQSLSKSPMGYALGLDLAHNLRPQWQLKLGLRYCLWQVPNMTGPYQWPSEQSNGVYQYDPSIAHYLITDYTQQDLIQLLPGIRWQSKAEEFRWIAGVEAGISAFLKNSAGISTKMHPTAGLSLGAEWTVQPNLHVFAQPGGRLIFRDPANNNTPESHLLNLQVELGARLGF